MITTAFLHPALWSQCLCPTLHGQRANSSHEKSWAILSRETSCLVGDYKWRETARRKEQGTCLGYPSTERKEWAGEVAVCPQSPSSAAGYFWTNWVQYPFISSFTSLQRKWTVWVYTTQVRAVVCIAPDFWDLQKIWILKSSVYGWSKAWKRETQSNAIATKLNIIH